MSGFDWLDTKFHQCATKFNSELQREWKVIPIKRFPLTHFITQGDQFFKTVWNMIDSSRHYFWITTYAMDSSPAADATLYKLIEAARRGVHVVLFLDSVQGWAKKELIDELVKAGGTFYMLNSLLTKDFIWKYLSKKVWQRHHEKLIVSDQCSLIGSSNIEGSYGGVKYGNCMFNDINFYSENIILDEYRSHFIETADFYELSLNSSGSNQQLQDKFNEIYPNSEFYPKGKYKLLHNRPEEKKRGIENHVYESIEKCQEQIHIIQAYHFPMSKQHRAINAAINRGVNIEVLTTGRREQPVFSRMFNWMFFHNVIKKGVKVYSNSQRYLHSKVYLFDRQVVSLGSMNNDRWSWKINNEVNIVIDCSREASFVVKYYNDLKKKSQLVQKDYILSASRAAMINFWQTFLYLSEIVMSKSERPEQDHPVNEQDVQFIQQS